MTHMVVGAKVCDLTEDLLWFVCGLYVGILTSPLRLMLQVTKTHLLVVLDYTSLWGEKSSPLL